MQQHPSSETPLFKINAINYFSYIYLFKNRIFKGGWFLFALVCLTSIGEGEHLLANYNKNAFLIDAMYFI